MYHVLFFCFQLSPAIFTWEVDCLSWRLNGSSVPKLNSQHVQTKRATSRLETLHFGTMKTFGYKAKGKTFKRRLNEGVNPAKMNLLCPSDRKVVLPGKTYEIMKYLLPD